MYYYQHHIGDYRKDTQHLTLLEHGVYRQLLDLYYTQEKPLSLDHAYNMRLICVRNADAQEAYKNVIKDFFIESDHGFFHKRCDDEIKKFSEKSKKSSLAANKRWSNNANDMRTHNERNANGIPTKNQEPITNNQELLKEKIKKETATASRLAQSWEPTSQDIEFCQSTRPDLNPHEVAKGFKDYWIAQAGAKAKKLDWSATWRNWVRNARQSAQQRPQDQYQSATDKAKTFADRLTGRTKNERIIDIN